MVVTSGSWVGRLEDRTQRTSRALTRLRSGYGRSRVRLGGQVTHREAEGSGGHR